MGATSFRAAVVTATVVPVALLVACAGSTPDAPSASGSAGHDATRSPSATVSPGRPAPAAPALAVDQPAWVSVSVATLWRSPASPRPVDRPALANPARISRWLSAMTVAQRRALNGRADTQALLGDRVRVVRLRPRWAKVVVRDQPTPQDARGYPGWVPRRQLSAAAPPASDTVATVVARLAWLRTDEGGGSRVLQVGFGTRLPVVGTIPAAGSG
ncbi:MAG: hypothetical protein R2734_02950 [Nocardioides sp.]